MLGNRAHKGLQPPSNMGESKGLKEALHAAHVRSAAHPHLPRTRGVISASLEGSRPKLWVPLELCFVSSIEVK